MEKRVMGNTGATVSTLGFGCMRFPVKDGKIDRELAAKCLDKAFEAGVNYYDTAFPYHSGESEEFLGEYLKKRDRASFYLASKLPCWEVKEKSDIRRLLELQLKKLQTEYIDFYLLHALNKDRYAQMKEFGVFEILEQAKKEGLIRHIGFSFHDNYESFENIIKDYNWEFCQIQYNYMDHETQATDRGLELAKSLGIPVVIMEPVKGGSLANLADDIKAEFEKLAPGKSLASNALRWVASHDAVKVVLSGMSSLEQVEDNIATFAEFKAFSPAEMDRVLEIADIIKSKVMNNCTGCRYCMPCPMGVDIPANFRIWNQYHMYGNAGHTGWEWNQAFDKAKHGDACVRCGKCETVCPQKISIRDDLAKLVKELDALK